MRQARLSLTQREEKNYVTLDEAWQLSNIGLGKGYQSRSVSLIRNPVNAKSGHSKFCGEKDAASNVIGVLWTLESILRRQHDRCCLLGIGCVQYLPVMRGSCMNSSNFACSTTAAVWGGGHLILTSGHLLLFWVFFHRDFSHTEPFWKTSGNLKSLPVEVFCFPRESTFFGS